MLRNDYGNFLRRTLEFGFKGQTRKQRMKKRRGEKWRRNA